MKKIILLCLSLLVLGCSQHNTQTIPVELLNGTTIHFPTTQSTRLEGAEINFYDDNGFLGYVQKETLPKEEQPATDFIQRSLALTKKNNKEIKEVSNGDLVGYVVYLESTATMHLASSKDNTTVLTISTADKNKIDQILTTLTTSK